MSYGATLGTRSSGTSDQDYEDMLNLIKSHIQQINSTTNRLNKSMTSIGTPRDTTNFRDSIRDLNAQTNLVIKETKRMLMDVEHKFLSDRSKKNYIDRLQKDFKDACESNAAIQKKVISALKMSLNMAVAAEGHMGSYEMTQEEADNEVAVEIYAQLQERAQSVEVDAALIAERDERIHQLERDMLMINDIMRDMADMVHEQGDMIDDIEANVERTKYHAVEANENLVKAKRFQAKARNKLCIILVILAVIAAVLVLVVVLALK